MYLRRNSKTKLEVSIDEPLNVDWDGNELLLSDILGTDEDVIYKQIETAISENYDEAIKNPLPKLYHERKEDGEKVRFSIPKKAETKGE
jgi:RNA polymerase sporulation-specific sigma factor